MPLDPHPLAPAEVAASIAVLGGALQAVLARWRDLSPVTGAAAGCAVVLALPGPSIGVALGVAVAAVLAAVGQARGARAGVGRPALFGLVIAASVVGGTAVFVLSGTRPEWAEAASAGVASAIGLLGVVAGALALDRPRSARPPVRWVGEIRVDPGRSR